MKKQLNEKHIYKGLKLIPKHFNKKVYELRTLQGTLYTPTKPKYENETTFVFPFGTKFYTSKFCLEQYETKALIYKTYETLVKEVVIESKKSKKPMKHKLIKK